MTEYWQSLTDRERLLVQLAGGLAVLVILYLAIIRPLQAYERESERALARAENDYLQVASAAAEIKAAGGAAKEAGRSQDPLRLAVAKSARAKSVQISRLQPGENGSLTVWIETVSSTKLYGWLQQLALEGGISPAKLNAQKSRVEGLLRVQIQFEE